MIFRKNKRFTEMNINNKIKAYLERDYDLDLLNYHFHLAWYGGFGYGGWQLWINDGGRLLFHIIILDSDL